MNNNYTKSYAKQKKSIVRNFLCLFFSYPCLNHEREATVHQHRFGTSSAYRVAHAHCGVSFKLSKMATREKRAHETDSEDEGDSKELRKYNQVFKPSYCKDFPFVTSSMKGKHHAFCKLCRTDVSISHGGSYDIDRHAKGKRHKENAAAAGSSSVAGFFKSKSDAKESEDSSLKTTITRSEAILCQFIAANNMSLSSAEKMTAMIRAICPYI